MELPKQLAQLEDTPMTDEEAQRLDIENQIRNLTHQDLIDSRYPDAAAAPEQPVKLEIGTSTNPLSEHIRNYITSRVNRAKRNRTNNRAARKARRLNRKQK